MGTESNRLVKKLKETGKIKCFNFSFYGRQEAHEIWRVNMIVTFASACVLITDWLSTRRLKGPQKFGSKNGSKCMLTV